LASFCAKREANDGFEWQHNKLLLIILFRSLACLLAWSVVNVSGSRQQQQQQHITSRRCSSKFNFGSIAFLKDISLPASSFKMEAAAERNYHLTWKTFHRR